MAQKAVAWQAAHPRATLEELEEALLHLRAEFSQQLARVLLEHREAAQPVPGPRCPHCGQEMHYTGGGRSGWSATRYLARSESPSADTGTHFGLCDVV
jgi:hypothetical protein